MDTTRYQVWKNTVLGVPQNIDGSFGAQCVDEALSWGQACFPGIAWNELFPPVASAKDMYEHYNPKYWDRVENNHNDPKQVPPQGAVAIFAASPELGYSSTFQNPDGHAGVVDHTDGAFIYLMQQDAGISGGKSLLRARPWRYTRLIGWLIPKVAVATQSPQPAQPTGDARIGKDVWLKPPTGPDKSWSAYRVGQQPIRSQRIGALRPGWYNHGPDGKPGLIYRIIGVSQFPNTVTIKSDTYGIIDVYLDADAQIL